MKTKSNRTKTVTTVIAALVIGLVLSTPMTIMASAQSQSTSAVQGRNIVLDKPSVMQVPVQKQLRDQLVLELKTTQSESSKAQIKAEIEKINTGVQQWFNNHKDPVKEKLIREKQDVLDGVLSGKIKGTGLNLAQSLPWSEVTYDYADNALEVDIPPHYFNASEIPKYFEMIRSVVGNQIDVALAPRDYPQLTSCTGYRVSCRPMEGAIQIEDTSTVEAGSIMFPATYNNQQGFVTAGHFVNSGDTIEQPAYGSSVGTVYGTEWYNGTNCDCSFVTNSTDISGTIYGYSTSISSTASPFSGMSVTMCGSGSQACNSGSVVATNVQVKYSVSGGYYIVNHIIESSYSSTQGDSGGPVVDGSDLVGVESGKDPTTGDGFSSPVGIISSDFSGLTWCFGC